MGERDQTRYPLALGGWSQAASLPPFLPCHSSLRASGLPRSPSLGLFFAGLGCPLGGEGAGSKGGEKEQLRQHNPGRLCSCPPWPGCHPLPEGPIPGHNGDPDPCAISSPGAEIGLSTLPAAEPQSQKGLGAQAEPWFLCTHGETEARRKDLIAQGHSTHGPPQ